MSYAAVSSLQPTPITGNEIFTFLRCHDDTHISRNWTHGNPNDGTFGHAGANHQNAYYYLNISTGSGCVASQDAGIHLVGRVTANGVGNPKRTDLSQEHPAWGFEFKDGNSGAIVHPCAGGNGSGGNNCPEHPDPIIASPGDQTVEFRLDAAQANHGYRFRVANLYDEAIWEYATLDVVACSTCEPAGVTSSTPTATPQTTLTPTPTPTPTSAPAGQLTPTPTPTSTPTPTATPTGAPIPRSSGCSTSRTEVFQRTASAGQSTSVFVDTSSVGTLTATVTWTPANTADLIVYDAGTLTVLSKQTGSSGTLTSSIDNLPPTAYKVKVHDDGATPITFTLNVTHC